MFCDGNQRNLLGAMTRYWARLHERGSTQTRWRRDNDDQLKKILMAQNFQRHSSDSRLDFRENRRFDGLILYIYIK